MPSTYTHYRFGKDVCKHLDGTLKAQINKNQDLFLIGLHGPDIFFYYGALKKNKVNAVGYGLHEKNANEFFDKSRERLERMPDKEEGLAYILGFICHFALDSECHGYIEYVIKRRKLKHTEIETDFERMLLLRDGKDPIKYNTASHIKANEEYCHIISSFFREITSYQVYKSLQSMKWYNQLLLPTNRIKVTAIKGVLLMTNNYEEMHGLIMPKKDNKACILSTSELERRYDKAVEIAVHLMQDYYEKLYTKERLDPRFNRTFGPDKIEGEQYGQEVYNA